MKRVLQFSLMGFLIKKEDSAMTNFSHNGSNSDMVLMMLFTCQHK